MDVIVGTAGHIDHGKTALVRALTGVDADRLPEEKRRGITIDLGFATLDLGTVKIGFVDVPGHERFVKNMLAGAHGIDLVALIIAADEGVMPQTREHFDICRLLNVSAGIVVLTKTDLVDAELLELVELETAELVKDSFLENAPVVAVSAKTGTGIDELKQTLREIALGLSARSDDGATRLPIDRAFSVRGFGTVVTGTLIAGEINTGDEMELLPGGKAVRARAVQVYGAAVERARVGQRVAVNLGGVEVGEVERGDVLAAPKRLRSTQILDAQLTVLPDAARALRSRMRVRLHLGTAEILARVQVLGDAGEIPPGESGFVQLRLEKAVAAVSGVRFIVRLYSPQRTVAGGTILDGFAVKHRRRELKTTCERLTALRLAVDNAERAGQLRIYLEIAGEAGATRADLAARTGWRDEILNDALKQLIEKKTAIQTGEHFIVRAAFEKLLGKILVETQAHHKREPLARGLGRETLRERVFSDLPASVFIHALDELRKGGQISIENDVVRATAYRRDLTPTDKILYERLKKIYEQAGLEPPNLTAALAEAVAGTSGKPEHARKVLQLFVDAGELVRVTPELLFRRETISALVELLREHAATTSDRLIDVLVFKDLAGVSRKFAIPLLEYFDREKITRRAGDKRLIL